ncbi:outer membrane beta-barrel protein [Tardiphaga sp. 37S4]|jgi:opacity protein-like surface antigen|uniref:Porin family protein n=1 Tax=Tardiphaga robiniae TaxID=943830 RepID=A0A7G6U7Q3_9BRAD|nr:MULTISPECIES: outer membrane beta-barrel protein [Tardiphaga]QND75035.1 porin family protein [Tardiphaga robiniae]UFS74107.1 outer membrane beta-barrel protein [Tardiphaga sp. 37S4]
MRRLLIAAALLGAVQTAQAADMPEFPALRGSFPEGLSRDRPTWEGFYVGGQAGYGTSDEKFTGSNSAMTAGLLSNTLIESEMGVSSWPLSFTKQSAHGHGYGAFAGYNSQWDDVVIGLEMSYLHGKFGGASSGSMSRYMLLSDGDYHAVTSSASSSIAISDIGTFRARAGYVWGGFMPYMFGGLALGQADTVRTVSIRETEIAGPTSTTPASLLGPKTPLTQVNGQYSRLIYGYTAGLGVDVNLVGGLFLRGEWEYIRFTSAVDTTINTVRAGVGYRF